MLPRQPAVPSLLVRTSSLFRHRASRAPSPPNSKSFQKHSHSRLLVRYLLSSIQSSTFSLTGASQSTLLAPPPEYPLLPCVPWLSRVLTVDGICFSLYLSPTIFVPQPCPDLIRSWDHILVGTNNGREVYKRARIASSRVPAKRITDDAATEHELFAAQMGPRKMVRTSWKQLQLGMNQQLFDARAMLHFGPEMAARDIMTARDGISRHYGWLARNNLEYPLDIKNHTWTGSLKYEVMTILPRKRFSNREFKIRLEERIYGEVHGGVPDDRAVHTRRIAPIRHRQTLAKRPDLSTISERSEPPSSPVRPRTKFAPLNTSPAKLLLGSYIEATPKKSLSPRKALSPFEFSFSSPPPANGISASTPAKKSSLIKSAAMWRTPDIFASTPKAVALSGSPPRSAPSSPPIIFDRPAVDGSPAKSRRSSTGSSQRGSRRSLTTSRLLAISALAQSPASPRVSFGPSDQTATPAQSSVADVTMASAPPLEESAVDATLSHAADSVQAASNLVELPLVTHDREFVAPADAEADFVVPANAETSFAAPTDAEASTAAPAIAEADFVVPANAEASFAAPASDHDDETKRIEATSEQASIHVDLRTNLDIFGAHRDVPASMTQMDDVDMVEEATPSPEKQANMDEDGADDGFISVINHSNINDTISLNLGVAQPSSGQPNGGVAGQGEDADEDREELQQFLNRHWAQAKGAAKAKRRSGSLGLATSATSVTGSPMPRSEVTADNETMGKRRPLGTKDPNMSPSPSKKRKAVDSGDVELSGGRSLLEAPALDDHSPPRPKRRRRNVEADSDGVLNPVFQQQAAQGVPRELRRSTRASARRNLVTAAPSANSTAMSKLPIKLPGSLVGDGADSSFGSSLSAARNGERRLAATTRTNTRKNRAGALPAGEVLALKAKQKTPPTGEDSGDEGPRAKKRTKTGMTKSVRWASVLARYQDEAPASSDAAGGPRPQPTPVKKTSAAATPSGPPPPGITASRVKKPAARATAAAGTPVARRSSAQLAAASAKMAALVSPPSAPSPAAAAAAVPVVARRTSAQLAAASAAKKVAAVAAASVAAPAARRTRIATPAPKKRAMRA